MSLHKDGFLSVSRVKRSGVYAYPAYGHVAVPVVAGPKGPSGKVDIFYNSCHSDPKLSDR